MWFNRSGLCEVETNPRFPPVIESIPGLTAKEMSIGMPGVYYICKVAYKTDKTISKFALHLLQDRNEIN